MFAIRIVILRLCTFITFVNDSLCHPVFIGHITQVSYNTSKFPLLKIHGDFVLITGDTISNMSLRRALQEHKERKKKDSNAVMTMVVKRSKPSPITHQSRLGTDELFMAIDPNTKQLVYYEDKADNSKGIIHLDKSLLMDNPSMSLRNDMQVIDLSYKCLSCLFSVLTLHLD